MDKPADQAATLYAMGELQGAELEEVMRDWRDNYETARGHKSVKSSANS
jgi:hypothetical protein